jgi:hypothetical protein
MMTDKAQNALKTALSGGLYPRNHLVFPVFLRATTAVTTRFVELRQPAQYRLRINLPPANPNAHNGNSRLSTFVSLVSFCSIPSA